MANTPIRTPTRRSRVTPSPPSHASPGPCPWKGTRLTVPGEVFKVPDTEYTATVKGWNGRKTDSIIAKFDDGSQYWFPLEDVLRWMGEQPEDVDPPTPFNVGSQSSPVRTKKAAGLRNCAASVAAASSKSNAEAANKQPVACAQQLQSQSDVEQQGMLSHHAAGIVCGVVLLLVVMLVAINASRGAAHDLEAWMDGMSELYSGVKARFTVRQSDWGSSHPQQVLTVVAQETAAEVWE